MLVCGHARRRAAPSSRLLPAPPPRLLVELRDVRELPALEEALLHEPYEALDLALRPWMPGPAEPRPEADGVHERLVVLLPDGIAICIPPDDYALHVVREHPVRDTELHEAMQHAYEEVLLPCVREELDVGRAAVVAGHREACDPRDGAVGRLRIGEPPVHLVCLAGLCLVSPAARAPGIRLPPRRRHERAVGGDVVLDRRDAACISLPLQAVEDRLGVRHPLAELVIDDAGVSREDRRLCLPACIAVRPGLEALLPERPCLRSRESGPPAELREVRLLRQEPRTRLGCHRREGLVYNLLQAIVSAVHLSLYSSYRRHIGTTSIGGMQRSGGQSSPAAIGYFVSAICG